MVRQPRGLSLAASLLFFIPIIVLNPTVCSSQHTTLVTIHVRRFVRRSVLVSKSILVSFFKPLLVLDRPIPDDLFRLINLVVKSLSGGNTKLTFVLVNNNIAKYFLSVTFRFCLRNCSKKLVAKLSQTFFVFVFIRIVVD